MSRFLKLGVHRGLPEKPNKTPTFFVGYMSASLRNQKGISNCWFDAVTFDIETGSKHCNPHGSALDRSGFGSSAKCRARDHVAAAGNKQMTSNRPDQIRSRRLIRERILCPSIVPLRMQCTSWQGQQFRCSFCCRVQPANNSAP